MAVRTYGPQIRFWIDSVFPANTGQFFEVVNVDEPFAALAIEIAEIKTAHPTNWMPKPHALITRASVALEAIHCNLPDGTLKILYLWRQLIRIGHALSKSLKCINYNGVFDFAD